MALDSIRIRLHLRGVRALGVRVDLPERLEVVVEDARRVVRCPERGFKTTKVHDRRDVRLRDLPVSGRPTTLIWRRRRFSCANCGERHVESHPEFVGRMTRRLAAGLVREARHVPVRELARRYGLGWHTVMAVLRARAETVARYRRRRPCRVLLVDETSLRRRHRYVTVIQNGTTGEVLAVVAHRNEAALSRFFIQQGRRWCGRVDVVVTDGSRSYAAAIGWHLSGATHVLDRFHAIRWFAAGLVEVRRRLQREGRPPGTQPAFEPSIFRGRFLQLRRADHLSATQEAALERVLAAHPDLARAWAMLQALHGIYQGADTDTAMEAIGRFTDLYAQDPPLPEFHDVVDTLLRHAPEILAFHTTGRASNGRIEGTNNKLGVLKHIAYGFTNVTNFAARALLLCPPLASSTPPSLAA